MKKNLLLLFLCCAPSFSFGVLCDPLEEAILYNSIIESPHNLEVSVGLLLEQVHIANSNVAKNITISSQKNFNQNATIPVDISHSFKYTQFPLDPGLSLSLGYLTMHDDFEINANFQWLHSKGIYNSSNENNALVPVNIGALYYVDSLSINPLAFKGVDSYLDVTYFLLDAFLKKGSYFSKNFTFTPFTGIKASWIQYQSLQNFFNAYEEDAFPLPEEAYWQRAQETHFWGVGPSVGTNINYLLFEGWSILSSLDIALLFGIQKISGAHGFKNGRSDSKNIISFNSKNSNFTPCIHSILGLNYIESILDNTQYVTLTIAFDGRVYFNQYPTVQSNIDSEILNESIIYPTYKPTILGNNPFAMLGLIVEITWNL